MPRVSEIPGEGAFDRVGLRVRGEFALIERTELGLRGKAPVKAAFNQRRVARDRDAGNRERRARALERQGRSRNDIAEGVLPLQRAARDQHCAIGQRHEGRSAHAEEGIAGVLVGACTRQRRGTTVLEERTIA
jgi:hypothetical protein